QTAESPLNCRANGVRTVCGHYWQMGFVFRALDRTPATEARKGRGQKRGEKQSLLSEGSGYPAGEYQ
ncbi:MAG: hypothetical protein ABIG91_02005, partial [Patescibacteria group bacterium]